MHTKCTLRHRTEDGSVGSIDAVELDVNFAQTMQLRGRAKEDPSFHNDERNANARRLVACWNACQDVPTQVLESIGKGYGPTWLQAKDERDELLTALKKCRFALEPYDDIKPRDWKTDRANLMLAHQSACAAIAKAEG